LAKAASVNPTFRVFRGSGGRGAGPGFRRVFAWIGVTALSANSGQWVITGFRIAQARAESTVDSRAAPCEPRRHERI